MLIDQKFRGFTMIELAVTIAIVGVLLAVAIPNYSAFLANSKIRSAATSVQIGLQLARTQAVQLNLPVEFALTSTEVVDAASATSATLSTSGPNWVVRVSNATLCSTDADLLAKLPKCPLIEAKSALEGSLQKVQIAAADSSYIFDGFGRNTPVSAGTQIRFTNPTGGACADSGPMRCLEVHVAPGGQARICDPASSVATGDSRHC